VLYTVLLVSGPRCARWDKCVTYLLQWAPLHAGARSISSRIFCIHSFLCMLSKRETRPHITHISHLLVLHGLEVYSHLVYYNSWSPAFKHTAVSSPRRLKAAYSTLIAFRVTCCTCPNKHVHCAVQKAVGVEFPGDSLFYAVK
jgi:hypothetical protein